MGSCMSRWTRQASLSAPRWMTTGWESQGVLGRCLSWPGQESTSLPRGQSEWAVLISDPAPTDEKPFMFQRLETLKNMVPHSLKSGCSLFWACSPLSSILASALQFQFYPFPTYSSYTYHFLIRFRPTGGIVGGNEEHGVHSLAEPRAQAEMPWGWATRKKF